MIKLIANRFLMGYLVSADLTVDIAQEQLHSMRLHDVARLVRDTFPAADSIVIDTRSRYVANGGVRLHSINSANTQAWSVQDRVPDALADYLTDDGYSWGDVVSHLDHELTAALGAKPPHEYWEPYDADQPELGLFTARLPSIDDVAAVQTVSPGRLTARLRSLDEPPLVEDPGLCLVRPVRCPTLIVGGAEISASLADDGTFTVDVTTSAALLADTGEGRVTVDVRLNGTSLTSPADSSS